MMSVRPIFWYALTAVLLLALGLGSLEHIALIKDLQKQETLALEQEYFAPREKTDTARFLAAITQKADELAVDLVLFTTESNNGQGMRCQTVAAGAYNDLAAWLKWLERQDSIEKIEGFVLENGPGEGMQMAIDLLLY